MKQKTNNARLIFFLSILCGLLLISIQVAYFMGKSEGIEPMWDSIISYIPTSITILLLFGIGGWNLAREQIRVNLTKRDFNLIVVLCLLFFPIGLFFLLNKKI